MVAIPCPLTDPEVDDLACCPRVVCEWRVASGARVASWNASPRPPARVRRADFQVAGERIFALPRSKMVE